MSTAGAWIDDSSSSRHFHLSSHQVDSSSSVFPASFRLHPEHVPTKDTMAMDEPIRIADMPESEQPMYLSGGFSDPEDDLIVTGTASPPACDKWSTSIEDLLADPAGLEVFDAYLMKTGSAASLSFWISCKMYHETCLSANRLRQAQGIYKQYLSHSSAPQHVKIGEAAMKGIRAALKAKSVTADVFVAAQIDTVNRMRDVEYPAFLKSDIYREYVEKASRRRHVRTAIDHFRPGDFSPPFAPSDCSFALSATDVSASINEDGSTLAEARRAYLAQHVAPKLRDDIGSDRLSDLPKDELPEPPPVLRPPRKYNYRPEEFFLLLRDRLEDVIRHNELPACFRPNTSDRQLGNIVEQPEMMDVDGPEVGPHRPRMTMPPLSSEGDLVSSVADLARSIHLDESRKHSMHRGIAQQRMKAHVHHHQHVHHHYPAEASQLSTTAAAMPSSYAYPDQSTATLDQWSLASTEPSESLYMMFERPAPYPSQASSLASYNSREGSDIMVGRQPVVFRCANRDPNHLSPPAERKGKGHTSSRLHRVQQRGIRISIKMLVGSEPKTFQEHVASSTVTLKDFKKLVTGNFRYYFMEYDQIDRQPVYQEYTRDSDFLPVYDGKVDARVGPN
eukprot:m.11667 g.11667  ORF g.11667 m.11667 type:complete len:618 (+) comp23540_c0_seq2:2-1855(+)